MFTPPPFHPARPDLVAPVGIDAAGRTGPTRAQARGASWRRTGQGRYVPATAPDSVLQRIVEAAAVLQEGEAVTGWAALAWRGARWFDGEALDGSLLDVPVCVCRHVVAPAGVHATQEHLRAGDVEVVDGLPVTTAVRSVAFEARRARHVVEARVAVEMAAYDDLVSMAEMEAEVKRLGTWTGVQQLRDALVGAEENVWSPPETRARCAWHDLRSVRLRCNVPLFGPSGEHLGTPDVLDEEAGVVGEYDGELHLVGAQRAVDVQRESVFRDAGLEYVTILRSDRAAGWRPLEARLRTAYDAALRPRERRWTTAPPPWWTDTSTVAARRALDEEARRRLLGHRRGRAA